MEQQADYGDRTTVSFTPGEWDAIAEFGLADSRRTRPEQIRALTLLGLDAWRTKGRPRAHDLRPPPQASVDSGT